MTRTPDPLTKSQGKRLRQLAGLAYDRELSHYLEKLEREFARWRGSYQPV